MKILLVNPPTKNMIAAELPLFIKKNEGIFPPLGLMYIASYLRKQMDCKISILDAQALRMDYLKLEKSIRDFNPDVVGITVYTHSLIDVIKVSLIVKGINKNTHVCLGGPHVDIFPEEVMSLASVDSAVLGEGEEVFLKLVQCLRYGSNLKEVRGIVFRKEGQIIKTEPGGGVKDLDSLPFPARDLLNNRRYYGILGRHSVVTTMVSSRGCPFKCSFCSTPKGHYRARSSKNVVDEMEACAGYGIKEVHFFDDTFNVDPERVVLICDEIIARKLNLKWSFRGRADKLNKPLLTHLKKSGCYRIHVGVETSSDEGLERLKKGITVGQVKQVFRWAREAGINTVAYFLIGCPHEHSTEDVLRTIEFSKDLDSDFALFNILTPYPSTELYKEGLQRGILRSDYWRDFALNPRKDFLLEFWQEWFTRKELLSLLRIAYREFYFRPKFILKTLLTLSNLRILFRRLRTTLDFSELYLKK